MAFIEVGIDVGATRGKGRDVQHKTKSRRVESDFVRGDMNPNTHHLA
jgi:hypothetical protein